MLKIAIVNHYPISGGMSGKDMEMLNISSLLSAPGTKIEAFSISNLSKTTRTKHIIEHQISGCVPGKSLGSRLLDISSLLILSRRPGLEMLNDNKQFISALRSFSPDLIISGTFLLSPLMSEYMASCHIKPKLISVFDSQRVIYNYLDSLDGTLLRSIKPIIKRRYIEYNTSMYSRMLSISDIVVLHTKKDEMEVARGFPMYKGRLRSIPTYFLGHESPQHPKKKIKRILFVGGYAHWPNREAIDKIEGIIAPEMPDKEFIIAGKGTPAGKRGNITCLGTVEDIGAVIRDSDICIAPLISGSGMKAKILDYFAAGRAVVGTNIAFDGFPVRNGVDAIVEDDLAMFPKRIRALERNPALFRSLQKNTATIRRYFSKDRIRRKWLSLVSETLAGP